MKLEEALCRFGMLRQRTCQGISALTHMRKGSSFLGVDEVEELSSLSFVVFRLEEVLPSFTRSEPLQFSAEEMETFQEVKEFL